MGSMVQTTCRPRALTYCTGCRHHVIAKTQCTLGWAYHPKYRTYFDIRLYFPMSPFPLYYKKHPTLRVSSLAGLQVYYYRNHTTNSSLQQTWRVEGMATLIKTEVYVAYLICNTTSNNGSGIVWMRGQVAVNSSLTEKLATNGVRLLINGFATNDLGNYICFDSLSNSYLTINITSGELKDLSCKWCSHMPTILSSV